MFDATSRILIFSIWMYVSNHGQFSSMSTLTGFYILVALLVVFNLVFSRRLDLKSFSFWTGGKTSKYLKIFYFLGLLLNSYASVLTFNDLDFKLIFDKINRKKDENSENWHQTTFIKQSVYNGIIFIILLV